MWIAYSWGSSEGSPPSGGYKASSILTRLLPQKEYREVLTNLLTNYSNHIHNHLCMHFRQAPSNCAFQEWTSAFNNKGVTSTKKKKKKKHLTSWKLNKNKQYANVGQARTATSSHSEKRANNFDNKMKSYTISNPKSFHYTSQWPHSLF